MTTATYRFTQRDPRYPVPMALDASLEFNFPNPDGRRLVLRLLELSIAGLSFAAESELPLLVRGARLDGVVIRIGGGEIAGRMLIKHRTRARGPEVIYGGYFYPETEQDQNRLGSVITRLARRA
jgi:hypothetical protein